MLPSSTFWKPNAAYDRLENAARKAIRVFASNWKEAISRPGSLDASGLFPVFRHHHYAAALEAFTATVRTAPLDSSGFVLLICPAAMWELSQGLTLPDFGCRLRMGLLSVIERLEQLELWNA